MLELSYLENTRLSYNYYIVLNPVIFLYFTFYSFTYLKEWEDLEEGTSELF